MPDPFDNLEEYRRLLAGVLLGDWLAERTLVDLLGPIIRHAVHGLTPPGLREELIQEVWAHLWARNCRVLRRWNGEGQFLGFVWVVARNQVRDRLATLRRRPPVEAIVEPPIVNPELAACINLARESLAPADQEIIHLRHDLGLSHDESAARLGITPNAAAVRLHRAEHRLREALWEKFGITFGRHE
jgi:RNA polymerase sigma factor (sigma-70 family)